MQTKRRRRRLTRKARMGLRVLASIIESGDMAENVTGYTRKALRQWGNRAEEMRSVDAVEAACKWIWSLPE